MPVCHSFHSFAFDDLTTLAANKFFKNHGSIVCPPVGIREVASMDHPARNVSCLDGVCSRLSMCVYE